MAVIALLAMAMPRAGANQLSDERANEQAKARALAAQIAALGQREDALGEQYDAAVATLDAANRRVAAASHSLAVAKVDQAKTLALLRRDAVETYVGGGQFALGSSSTLATMNDALLSQELQQTFASDQTNALDGYRESQVYEGLARAQLVAARDADARQLARLDKDRNQVQAAADQLVGLEQQVKGRIATIVEQIRAEQLAAERRAEAARLAALRAEEAAQAARLAALQRAQEKAQAALRAQQLRQEAVQRAEAAARTAQDPAQPASLNTASAGGVPTPVTVPQAVPGVSEAAAIAVQAAESRVGDPYVWGAAGPDYFDCSGLVMWAYAQAGVYLPHFSGAQYADTIHIPMSDLEPGDLVFPADPGEHVAMYVGNGDIVQAPYTGADVQVVPLDPSFLVLASRVG
jgi:cell wall-associated NlpC family hydrolase